MIAASSLAFPGSKTLSTWWRQLAPFQPSALWVGHLFVHRLEALARVVRTETIEPLPLLLLRNVALEQAKSPGERDWPRRLDDRLHLGEAVIGRLLRDLEKAGLLSTEWLLTPLGRLAVEKAGYPRPTWQRREFIFAERLRPDGQRLAAPHFLPLALDASPTWQPDDGTTFDLDWLLDCPAAPLPWRERFAFPADVQKIAAGTDHGEEPAAWQHVVIDRPERTLIAVIATGADLVRPEKFCAFAARQEGWELRGDRAIVTLPFAAAQELPEFAERLSIAAWTRVWQSWCQARQLSAAEANACILEQAGNRLSIQAPPPLIRQLETARSDLLKGDAWFLGGDGYLRMAVQVQLSAKPSA